ncbi:FtsW/RodA/SpoVE family cell cycle protein [Gulosibacter molinativorax]|uniref:FtsW/RodA/SpoVE family cell cycle protein n=1 Tax=Gulosibacter molinativorax TaxID=256821 RepID=A0ABT7C7X8_9MICO|nr:FtsW/RodA/SpoVE family cell cycle protein [Gulosibacter molinativorax]MDJ1371252.1 FtsW/RodA/SpoVE family cell cycle protein [Gulosibacter molinativorax]QUY63068.1 Cell division membrane protein [Gulosibacter molinativorax]
MQSRTSAPAGETSQSLPKPKRQRTQGLRNMELGFLIFAYVIVLAALLQVQLGVTGAFDFQALALLGFVAILTLAMHVVLRFIAPQADPFILPIATTLNGLGISMIYRLELGGVETANSFAQILYTGIGVAFGIAVLFLVRNHRILQRYTYLFGLISLVLLLLPLIPGLGVSEANARVWISIGPFNFQPGEIAKVTIAIFFAGYLVTARDSLSMVSRKFLGMKLPRMRDLGPILVVWAICMAILVFQRDLGTSLLYFGLFLVMIFVSTGRISWVVIGLVLFVAGATVAAFNISYVNWRVMAWLDPLSPEHYDAVGGSYQLVQGMFGLANGGLIGTGLGQGRPDITPLAESDFIIAALGEELGLAGLFAILCLYLLFVARGFRIGHQGGDDFGRLLATGLAFVIGLQVFIVVGGVTRVIPLTGLTTPFLAAGGSSLLTNWIIVAILLRLSDTVKTSSTPQIKPASQEVRP